MKSIAQSLRLTLLVVLVITSELLVATDQTIWKVGTFNHSSGEFRNEAGIDYADAKSDPVFIVGQSKDADWYRFQPGPANGMTGGRLHPFTVKFALNNAPHGVYHLRIAMLYETPRLSFLKLDINGHSGCFYFHPTLDFNAGDWEGTFVPQTSVDEKTIAIPAAWLRQGDNTLTFTALDDPATPQNSLGGIAPGHTGLVYDALEFTQDSSAQYDAHVFSVRVEPTIFYRSAKEVVDVYASAAALPKNGTVELTVAGKTQSQSFSTDQQFGELRLSFEVPEWRGRSKAAVRMGAASQTLNVDPGKKWTIAIIPHEHLDIGFTDYPAKVAELHAQSIDGAMELIKKTPDFRWTLDGSWVANQYLHGRSQPAREDFLAHVRDGSITIPPEFANIHTGNASWEGLARSLYNQHELAKEYKLPGTDAAHIVDVPSYTWAYASVLHDAGIKYFVAASNSWRAPIMLHGRWNEKSPFYWEGPDGGRVLMWYSRAYLQAHTLFAGPWRMEAIRDALPVFLQAYTRPDYTANTAIIFGTQLENTTLAKEQSEIVGTFNRDYEWPKLEFATVHSAMQQIEHEWKGDFLVYRGDFGPYWEDGYGSEAHFTAIHRENQHRLATAEIMGAGASSVDPRVRPNREMFDDAWWNELVFDEHTWTYVGATAQAENHQSDEQTALKGSRVERAHNDITESIQREWAQLEALVRARDASVAVFNSLNWPRSGVVETDIPEGMTLVDATSGNEVPIESLFVGKGIHMPGFGPRNVRVRFMATDVPAIGYKLFTLKPRASASATEMLQGKTFENEFYRITLAPETGALSSVFDKQLNRELVDQASPYKFGAYLYVTGGDDYPKNSLYRFGAGLNPPELTVHAAQSGKFVSARRTPLGIVLTLRAESVNTPSVDTEIMLPAGQKQILLTYRVRKDKVLTRESAYIAFPFAVTEPQFSYGSQGAPVNPAKDELAGGSREWYLPTTWAAVSNGQVAGVVVPVDAPLMCFGDIMRGKWPTQFKPKNSTMFSWLMNNYWGTNFPAWQGGGYTFRYAITSEAKVDPVSLNHFGWNALTPLERDDVAASTERSELPSGEASLVSISNPAINVLAWKLAEDGDGTILRLQETAGAGSQFNISSKYLKFDQAWLCDITEDKKSVLATSADGMAVSIKPFQVLTIRVRTSPRLNGSGS